MNNEKGAIMSEQKQEFGIVPEPALASPAMMEAVGCCSTLQEIHHHNMKFVGDGADLGPHLHILYDLAKVSPRIVEFGVRCGVSTCSLLAGLADSSLSQTMMRSYDVNPWPFELNVLPLLPDTIDFQFNQQSSLDAEIPECDLLFIDSRHDYDQLQGELELHANRVEKFIVLHDTEKFGVFGESHGVPGLHHALGWFLVKFWDRWRVVDHRENNSGLTILGRTKAEEYED